MSKKILRSHLELMNAFLEILSQKEYNKITVSEICKISGYNRGTFYQNFTDKDDLLNNLIDMKLKEMVDLLKNQNILLIKHMQSKSTDYTHFFNLLNYVKQNYFFFKAVLDDKQIIGFRYKFFLHFKSYLEEILISTIKNPNQDYEIEEYYFHYATSSCMGLIMYWINNGIKESPDYLIEQFLHITNNRPHDLIIEKIPFKNMKTKVEKERDPRIVRTKNDLSNAMLILMEKKSYDEIKVNDILEIANYNRTTFYSHFKGKDELFFYMVSKFIDGMIEAIRQSKELNTFNHFIKTPPLERLFNYIYENYKLIDIVLHNNKVPGFFNAIYTSLVLFFMEELEGRFDYDIKIYANYLSSTILTTISFWISKDLKYSPKYMAYLFTTVLCRPPQKKSQKNISYF